MGKYSVILTNTITSLTIAIYQIFENTINEKTDYRSSFNYYVNPDNNRIKKTNFSLSGIIGLLDKYGKLIENASSQQKVLCNWGMTLKQSSAVHIQALYSGDVILPGSSSKLRLLVINLASVPGRQLVNSPTAQSLERFASSKEKRKADGGQT